MTSGERLHPKLESYRSRRREIDQWQKREMDRSMAMLRAAMEDPAPRRRNMSGRIYFASLILLAALLALMVVSSPRGWLTHVLRTALRPEAATTPTVTDVFVARLEDAEAATTEGACDCPMLPGAPCWCPSRDEEQQEFLTVVRDVQDTGVRTGVFEQGRILDALETILERRRK